MAIEDAGDIISDDDGFSTPLSFTPIEGDPFVLNGLATVHSQGFDSNGIPIIANNSHILFSEKAVNALGYTTRNSNGNVNVRNWKVEFDHAVGSVKAILSKTEPDSTLGLIRVMITNYEQD